MLPAIELTRVLFLDIETVSGQSSYQDLDEDWKKLWEIKGNALARGQQEPLTPEELSASYEDKAGIFSEFGKIVCISVGILLRDRESRELNVRLTSFQSADEKVVLKEFSKLLEAYYPDQRQYYLCGHNIREFDIPFICRRLVIHGLPLPGILQIAGKKPWETKFMLDTLELWRFGDYKNYTSLKLLTKIFNIPSPKDDIDGSEVGRVFWKENDLDRIARYCEKDVLAVVQLLMRYQNLPLVVGLNVVHV